MLDCLGEDATHLVVDWNGSALVVAFGRGQSEATVTLWALSQKQAEASEHLASSPSPAGWVSTVSIGKYDDEQCALALEIYESTPGIKFENLLEATQVISSGPWARELFTNLLRNSPTSPVETAHAANRLARTSERPAT